MHGIVEALNQWGAEAGTLAVAAVWQSTLVALLVAVAAFALRRSSPTVRYWLWQIVAVKLLVMPLWSWSLAVPWLPEEAAPAPSVLAHDPPALPLQGELPLDVAASAAPQTRPAVPAGSPSRGALAELSWRGWLLLAWAAIVLLQAGRLAVQRVRLARLLRGAERAPEELAELVGRVGARLNLKRRPRVLLTELECSPFVCGIVHPALVVPRELAESLEAAELEQIVAHELAHVRRRDLVWGWIPEIARILYFFHPIAHLASYRIRLERELACDQLAMLDSGRTPAEYAETLVRVITSASRPSIFRTSAAAGLDGGAPITPDETKQ